MPAGQIITGEDGIINLKETGGTVIGEVPCLKSFSVETSADLSENNTKCMKSNDDGGSGSDGGWKNNRVSGKSWSATLEFAHQKEATNVPGAIALDLTNVGDELTCEFFPNDKTSGDDVYSGNAIIESVSQPQEVDGDIYVTVNVKGNGALTKSQVV